MKQIEKRKQTMTKNLQTTAQVRRGCWRFLVLCAVVCGGFAGLTAGCGSPLDEAKKAIAGGKYEAAQEIAVEQLEERPNDGDFYTVLAEAQLGLDDPDQAAALAERGTELRPDSAYAYVVAGLAFGRSQRLSASCEAFGSAWALDRVEIESRREAVLALLPQAIVHARDAGELERAVTCYTLLEALDKPLFEADHKAGFAEIGRAYAVRLRDVGRLQESQDLWSSLAAKYPDNEVAYSRELGLVLAAKGEFEAAKTALDVYVARSNEGGSEAARLQQVAVDLDGQGRLALASDYLKRALDKDPKYSDAQQAYALSLLRLQKEAEATPWIDAFLDDARRDRPLNADDAHKFSRALLELGWGAQAERALETAHTRFPEDANLGVGLAERRLQRGDFAQAEVALQETVEALLKQPQGGARSAAFEKIAGWLEIQDRRQVAVQILQRATTQAPEPSLLLVLAKLYGATRQVDAFEQTLLRYVEASGGGREARIQTAELMLRRQSAVRVPQVLEPLVTQNPADDQAVQMLGKVYALQGRGPEEVALYDRWALASPQPALAFLEVGDRLAKSAQIDAAQRAYERAGQLDATQISESWFRRGVLLHQLGKAEDSQKAFDESVATSAQPQDALEKMLGYFTERNDPARALAVLDALIARDPQNPAWYFFQGEQWMMLGQEEKARAAFVEHALKAPVLEIALKKGATVLVNRANFRVALDLMDDFDALRPDTIITLRLRGELYADHSNIVSRGGADPDQVMLLREQSRKQWAAYVEKLAQSGDAGGLISSAATLASRGQFSLSVRAFELVPGGAIPPVQGEAYGRALVMLGRKQESIQQFDLYIQSLPAGETRGRALLELGLFLSDEGLGPESDRYLSQAIDEAQGPTQRDAFRILAIQAARSGDRPKVSELASRAVERANDRPRMMREVAEVFARIGEDALAIKWYRALLKLRPNASDIVLDMAALAQRAGDAEQAMSMLRAFAEVSATPSLTWQSIGQFLRDSGYPAQALEAFESALRNQLDPEPPLLLEIARLHCVLNAPDAALPLIRRYLDAYTTTPGTTASAGRPSKNKGNSSRQAYLSAVQMLEDTQQHTLAEQFAAEAGLLLDDPLPFWLRRISFSSRRGDLTASMFWTGRYLQESSGRALAALVSWMSKDGLYAEASRLINLEVDFGDYTGALTHTQALSQRIILNDGIDALSQRLGALLLIQPFLNIDAAQSLTERLIASGRHDDAIVWLGRMIRARGLPEHRLLRAKLLLSQNQPDEALRTLEPLVTAPPSTYHLRQTSQAVNTLLDADQPALAESILNLALTTGHAELLPLLVSVRLSQGRLSDALSVIEAALHDDSSASDKDNENSSTLSAIVALARHGYSAEARKLIERARPSSDDPSHALTEIEILALSSDPTLSSAIDSFRSRWPNEESAEDLAQTLLRAGAFDSAAQVAKSLLSSPNHRRALSALSLTLAASPPSNSNLNDLVQQFLSPRSDRYRALLDASLLLSDQGAFELADSLLSQALSLVGGEAAPFERLSEIKYLLGDIPGAANALNQAALRRPDRADTFLRFALQTSNGPDPRLSAEAFRLYLSANPRDPSALLALARLEILSDDSPSAQKTLDTFISSSSLPDQARQEAFVLLVQLQNWQQAKTLASLLPPHDHLSPSTLLSLCNLWLSTNQDTLAADALSAFSNALSRSPHPLEDRLAAAELFRQQNKLPQVEQFIASAIESEPHSAAPRLYRALLRIQNNDIEGASLDLDYVASHGHDPLNQLTPAIIALLSSNNPDSATPYLLHILNSEHLSPSLRTSRLLSIFSAAQKPSNLIPFLASHRPGWLRNPERNPWLLHSITQALLSSPNAPDALSHARLATLRQPQEPAHWDALARAALHQNLQEEALSAAQRSLLLSRNEDRKFALQTLGKILASSDPKTTQRLWLSALRLDQRSDPSWTASLYSDLSSLLKDSDPLASSRFSNHAKALSSIGLNAWNSSLP